MLGLGLLAGGAALGESTGPAITVRLPRATFNMHLSGTDIVAPHVQLSRTDSELRGRVNDTVANFKLEGDKLSGTLGITPVNLQAHMEGDTLQGEGGFAGSPAEVRLSPSELHVYINSCTYRLKYTEGRYVGPRSCDPKLARPVEIALPEAFKTFSPVEQVTFLLLALG